MTDMIILLTIGGLVSGLLIWYGSEGYGATHTISAVLGVLIGMCVAVSSVGCAILGYYWVSSEYQAKIINREYGTNYTKEEVFYASNVIETIRQLDRKRYEINGDVMKDKEK